MKKVKIRVLCPLENVFPEYQPIVGEIYDAEFFPGKRKSMGYDNGCAPFCAINILDKRIVVRKHEFEIVGGNDNG